MSRIPAPTSSARRSRRSRRSSIASTTALGLVSLIAFALSFHGLSALLQRAGFVWILAAGVPLLIDGTQLAAALRIDDRLKYGLSTRGAWAAIIVSSLLSMAGNGISAHVLYGDQPPLLAYTTIAVGVCAPIFLTWTFHMTVGAVQDRGDALEAQDAAVVAQSQVMRSAQPPKGPASVAQSVEQVRSATVPVTQAVVPAEQSVEQSRAVQEPIPNQAAGMEPARDQVVQALAMLPTQRPAIPGAVAQIPAQVQEGSAQVAYASPGIMGAPGAPGHAGTSSAPTIAPDPAPRPAAIDLAGTVRAILDKWVAENRDFGPEDWQAIIEAAPVLAGPHGYSRPGREIPKRVIAYLSAREPTRSSA